MEEPAQPQDPADVALDALGYAPDHPIRQWVTERAKKKSQSRIDTLRDLIGNVWAAEGLRTVRRKSKRRR